MTGPEEQDEAAGGREFRMIQFGKESPVTASVAVRILPRGNKLGPIFSSKWRVGPLPLTLHKI